MSDQIKYKVSLTDGCSTVIFEASSPITEGRTANYDGFNIVHLPTDMWSYRNTSARHFGISGKLVSRNASEAAANSYYVDIIRSWILPDFGGSGATPPVLFLSAYNNTNINKVQCILRSYNIMFPDDVDWIFDGSTVNKPKGSQSSAMPVICNIQLDLEESYSPTQITNKKWRINQSTGGSFVIGGSAKDNTPGGGGQQQTVTPDAGVCANNPKFGGIAADSSSDLSSGITNGDMTGIFGLKDSVGLLTTFPKGGVADKLSKMTPSSINGVVLPDVIANTKYVAPLKPDRIAEIANYVKTPSPYDATINAAGA